MAVDDDAVRHRGAGPPGERREEVHRRGQLIVRDSGRHDTRPADDGRDPHAAFRGAPLGAAERGVAALARTGERPVVAGEDDDRVVGETEGVEFVEQHAGGPVDGVDGGAVGAVARAAVERVLHVQRQVDVHVSEVEKEWPVDVVAHELDRSFDIATGQHRLVGLLLDDLLAIHQRQRRIRQHRRRREAGRPQGLGVFEHGVADLGTHVVAVRQTEPSVEAVVGRQKLGLVTAMPLADDLGDVPGVLQHRGNGVLLGIESVPHPGEEHMQSAEVVEADAARIRTGQHRAARRCAHRGRHVEAGEPHAFIG